MIGENRMTAGENQELNESADDKVTDSKGLYETAGDNAVDNSESYETVSWILDNADTGFFIITAPYNMQKDLAERYKTSRVEIFDYAQQTSPFSYPELSAWADSCQDSDFLFVLNMQLALRDENDMLSFNLSRDMLSKKNKAWFFFMTKDLDYRLSTFAFDIYSFVRLKAHFLPEKGEGFGDSRMIDIEVPINYARAKEALERYRDLEAQLVALVLEGSSTASDNQLISAAASLSNIAELYSNCADFENALRLFEIVRGLRERLKGMWHPDTADTYNDIAYVYYTQGNNAEALKWFEKAMAIQEKVLGIENASTAGTYSEIGMTYSQIGDYAKALEWLEKALAIQEKAMGRENYDTAVTYYRIAGVYFNQGDFFKALAWNEKSLAIFKKVRGEGSIDTVKSYNFHGVIYSVQGEMTKATDMYDMALKVSKKVLGREHPTTAVVNCNIALSYEKLGNVAKALEMYDKEYAVCVRTLDSNHPNTVRIRRDLERLRNRHDHNAVSG